MNHTQNCHCTLIKFLIILAFAIVGAVVGFLLGITGLSGPPEGAYFLAFWGFMAGIATGSWSLVAYFLSNGYFEYPS